MTAATPPSGTLPESGRFVWLRHECPPGSDRDSHWDLMLEAGSVLRTWALETEPNCDSAVRAEVLPDHRLAYLEYEGPISGDRGAVTRVDAGTYHTMQDTVDHLVVRLNGTRLRGVLEIHRGGQAIWHTSQDVP